MVLYGDHLPPLPIPPEQLKSGSLYMTEYVIWSNFDIEAPDKTLSAYELSAYVLGLTGIDRVILRRFISLSVPKKDATTRCV